MLCSLIMALLAAAAAPNEATEGVLRGLYLRCKRLRKAEIINDSGTLVTRQGWLGVRVPASEKRRRGRPSPRPSSLSGCMHSWVLLLFSYATAIANDDSLH
uniref:Putative secreted protein n=1 Tax=Anopheles darlingi TaxID=43151 RepID=A0A2M4DFT5_ANODA